MKLKYLADNDFADLSGEALKEAISKRIKETGIRKAITGHCTGDEAFKILKEELGDVLEQMYTGMVIEL